MLQLQADTFMDDYGRLRAMLSSFLDSQRRWPELGGDGWHQAVASGTWGRSVAKTNAPGGRADMDVDALFAKGAGGKGKGKSKGKGKDKGNDKKTACFICGGLGHFARECPQSGASGPSGGKGRGKQNGKGKGKGKTKAVHEVGANSPDPDTGDEEVVLGTTFVDEGAGSGWLFAVAAAGGARGRRVRRGLRHFPRCRRHFARCRRRWPQHGPHRA